METRNGWPAMRPMQEAPKDRPILIRWDVKARSGPAGTASHGFVIVKRSGRQWVDVSTGGVVLRPSGFWDLPGEGSDAAV